MVPIVPSRPSPRQLGYTRRTDIFPSLFNFTPVIYPVISPFQLSLSQRVSDFWHGGNGPRCHQRVSVRSRRARLRAGGTGSADAVPSSARPRRHLDVNARPRRLLGLLRRRRRRWCCCCCSQTCLCYSELFHQRAATCKTRRVARPIRGRIVGVRCVCAPPRLLLMINRLSQPSCVEFTL